MASHDQEQRDGANGSTPSTNDSALSIKTAGGTEIGFNDPWMARIVVTTVCGVGIYVTKNLVSFLHENRDLVRGAIQLAFQTWGVVKDVKPGSIIVDLDCGSKEKFSKFNDDFEDGKVKDAMEEEFRKIGYNEKLQLALKEKNVAVIKTSTERVIRETKEIAFLNPSPDKAEVREDPKWVDKLNKRDFQWATQRGLAASHSTEVEREEDSVDSGSAAKRPKLDPVKEPGTSGVTSTSRTMKEGTVTDDDLQTLGNDIAGKWDRLGRRLKITNAEIEGIQDKYQNLSQRGYHMLVLWKTNNGEAADYKTLHDALVHELVKRKDLAEKYCLLNNNIS